MNRHARVNRLEASRRATAADPSARCCVVSKQVFESHAVFGRCHRTGGAVCAYQQRLMTAAAERIKQVQASLPLSSRQ